MKSQLSVSRERLTEESRVRYNLNCQIVLQLYSIYKAETVIKTEPRIPSNDPRRPVLQRQRRIVLASFVKQHITSRMSSIRASRNDLNHSIVSLFKN